MTALGESENIVMELTNLLGGAHEMHCRWDSQKTQRLCHMARRHMPLVEMCQTTPGVQHLLRGQKFLLLTLTLTPGGILPE